MKFRSRNRDDSGASRVPRQGQSGVNPLARRVAGSQEPDTMELSAGAAAVELPAEPETRDMSTPSEPVSGPFDCLRFDPSSSELRITPGPSGNPVRVNGEIVEAPRVLNSGDIVVIGSFSLRVE